MTKKKISSFYKILIIYTAVIVVLCATGLAIFADYIYNYELSLPESCAKSFIESLKTEDLEAIMKDVYPGKLNPIEDKDKVYSDIYESEIMTKLEFYKAAGIYKEDVPAYNVFNQKGSKLFLLKLQKCGEYRYGLPKWEVSMTEPYTEDVSANKFDFTVIVPYGAELIVNGSSVPANYIAEEKSTNCYLSKFEKNIVNAREYTVYYFDKLSIVPEISVIYGENEKISLTNFSDVRGKSWQKRIYLYPEDRFYSVEFNASSFVNISVNGINISDEFIKSSTEITDVNAFEKDNGYSVKTYLIPNLLTTPEIKVKFLGEEITPDENGNYVIGEEHKKAMTFIAPKNAKIALNGVSVTGDYAKNVSDTYGLLDNFKKYVKSTANLVTYTISGFYCVPEITASLGDTELTLICMRNVGVGETIYEYVLNTEKTLSHEVSSLSETFLRDYINFVSSGYVDIDLNHEVVMNYMLEGTPGYNIMKKSYNTVKWNSKYEKLVYNSVEIRGISVYHDNLVGCKISYDISLYDSRGSSNAIADTMTLLFIKDNDKWMIGNVSFGE